MLISNYKRVKHSHNPPARKCYYCKRRSHLKPFAGYYLCIYCNAVHKLLASAALNKPVLRTGRFQF